MRLADPAWLAFLVLAAAPWVAHRRRARVAWPTLGGFPAAGRSRWARWVGLVPVAARSLAIAAMVVALARPQAEGEQVRISGRGLAIGLVIDRSSSMKAVDFPGDRGPTGRLDAAKRTILRFLEARADDLIGLVAFANLPETVAPPTLDRRFTWEAARALQPAGALDDGTDLGGAIAWGLGMVRPLPARRKVLVLLTDGRHAPGSAARSLDPVVAADLARGLGVTLHTVAIGRPGPTSPQRPEGSGRGPEAQADAEGPDFDLLRRLADRGGGRAFVAADAEALDEAFREIDALEVSTIEGTVRTVYGERFLPWALAALGLVAVDLGLASGRFRRNP